MESLRNDLYDGEDNVVAGYQICWSSAERIIAAITSDLEILLGICCYITKMEFIIRDKFYRQSANGCFMILKTEGDTEFELSVECIIDYQRVLLQVKQLAETKKMNKAIKKIMKRYDAEQKAELNSIKS
ncbi:MAG: hypothetical protein AAF992_15660 [Bacteroidota bacterium]